MISYIQGKLTEINPSFVVVDCNGVGYKLLIPASVFTSLPQKDKQIKMYTSFITRELSQTLYGFLLKEERNLFEELITINGVGPKLALSLIGHLPLDKMHQAIGEKDILAISQVPGIGKKTAERLLFELRNRLTKSNKNFSLSDFAIKIENDPQKQKIQDAINALINLGYNQIVAQNAIKKSLKSSPDKIDLAILIKDSLKHVRS